jgi:bacterioferritin (cytochrome b1)
MARGWESKAVEEQQAEATAISAVKRDLTPEQRATQSLKEGLTLSRTRIQAQLRSTQNPRYRKMLEETLADLEGKLHKLDR